MKEIYLKRGRIVQLDKLKEEVRELCDAILSGDKVHASEEAADVLVVVLGIIEGEGLHVDLIEATIPFKQQRELARIEEEGKSYVD